LSAPVPNPTRAAVAMTLSLPAAADVAFDVIDIQGREVWRESAWRGAGMWTLTWDGRTTTGPARTGVYLARVRVGATTLLQRFAIVR